MAHYIYILECADKTLYVGSAKDVAHRVTQHNEAKKGARYTKSRRPVVLRYSERLGTLSAALKREYELKQLTRASKLAIIAKGKRIK